MTDDIDPVAFDRWLVPGGKILKLGFMKQMDGMRAIPFDSWVVVASFPGRQVWVSSTTGPVTALTLLHALHERGMLRPEACEPVAP